MKYAAGLDEVGRGCLAGPVAVGLYVYPEQQGHQLWTMGAKDSKKLSEKKRAELYESLVGVASYHTVSFIDAQYIDTYGIDSCISSALTHALATIPFDIKEDLSSIYLDKGLKGFWARVWEQSGTTVYEAAKDGESVFPEVAAASIIAKHTRDQYMIDIATKYADYGWENNKGYGTHTHYQAIDQYGITDQHRRRFLRGLYGVEQ